LLHPVQVAEDADVVTSLDRLWSAISERLFGDPRASAVSEEEVRKSAQAAAPVLWLLGKTGAGKTAIISTLTGDPRAEVGAGFEPCTRTAAFYDVPTEIPLVRFLDTRGVDEADYDPAKDIAWCESQSHLLLVVMQAADPVQDTVLRVVREARHRHPEWPVVVAQTGLHRLYPAGVRHPEPYPFTGGPEDETNPLVPHDLRRALAHQRRLFHGLRGRAPQFVPIDFTLPEDGFPPQDFGIEALRRVLEAEGLSALETLHRARADAESDRIRARARPLIYGYGVAAGGAGAVPIPLLGVSSFVGILALMLRTLAGRYQVVWTRHTFAEFTTAIGGGALLWWALRYGVRELLKFIPVIGTIAAGALNAAAAFGVTIGLGEAACVWLSYRRRGDTAPPAEVRRAFAQGLAEGLRRAKNEAQRSQEAAHEVR
jgi:uncharacterized protein (DUF697 family)